ncbi:MAG: M36 family metallopeptidase [Nannocystaceae bacterium]
MLTIRALPLLALLGLTATDASAADRTNFNAALAPAPAAASMSPTRALRTPAIVHATDPARGLPSLVWVGDAAAPRAGLSAVDAAREHLVAMRGLYEAPRAAIDGAAHRFTHDPGRGPIVVAFTQRVGDVEVFGGDLKVLLGRDHRLLAISGTPHPAALAGAGRSFRGGEAEAIAAALRDLYDREFTAADLTASTRTAPRSGSRFYDLAPASSDARADLRFEHPARAKPVYFPIGDALVPAHMVEVLTYLAPGTPLEAYQYVIAADDGRVLLRRDLIASDAYTYRVWAEADPPHRPFDGPMQDWTPHPTGMPDVGPTDSVKPNYVAVEGLNKNPEGKSDPWLPSGALETVGNNVDAYVDHKNPSGYNPEDGEFRATVTEPGTFDVAYDLGEEPLASTIQSQGAIVELFFMINWLHDWWYDSGFNEAAGNAQSDNFGRGGVDSDPIQGQAQDGALEGSLNNANMATPSDGVSPVMQMYLWSPNKNEGTLTVTPGDVEYTVSKANFGPLKFDLSGDLVFVDDGEGADVHDGCEPPKGDVAGKIVLIHRGNCTFETKVLGAEMAGAVAVIISNHMDTGLPQLGNDNMLMDPTIPTLGVSLEDGAKLEASIEPTSAAHITGITDVYRDGTIDNMIIAHEFGHYLHHRLENCGNRACGSMSEGWGDFNAVLMALREGDPLDAVYSMDSYAGADPWAYYGLRRVPYSSDFAKNALTFRNIVDGESLPDTHPVNANGIANSEVHNAGEVWTTMMWEVYIALHKAHAADMTFDEVRRLMSDYVVTGMMMTPVEGGWLEQRDAILLAAAAADMEDFQTIAEAFARRGVGSCAIAPPIDSVDFVGVVEDFQLQANGHLLAFTLDDSASSCDNDGVVDGGELGRIHVEVANGGAKPLPAGSVVEIVSPTASVVFPSGSTAQLPALAPLEKTAVDLDVALIKGLVDDEHVTVRATLTTPEGCSTVHEIKLPVVLNGDLAAASSKFDDVEVPETVWTLGGAAGKLVWSRVAVDGGHAWRGADLGAVTDAQLISPVLQVSATEPLVMSFVHAYQFEFSDNTYWDGGVIEYSEDGAKTWQDVAGLASVPYNGMVMSDLNPINGQAAFVNQNPSYPSPDAVSLDFGQKLAGKAVQFRFRVATDSAAGALGWQVDDIGYEGIDNTPFPIWVPDQAVCAGEETTTTAGTESDTSGETGTESDDSASTGPGTIDDNGCNCSADARGPGLAGLGLLLLGFGGRRRRRG